MSKSGVHFFLLLSDIALCIRRSSFSLASLAFASTLRRLEIITVQFRSRFRNSYFAAATYLVSSGSSTTSFSPTITQYPPYLGFPMAKSVCSTLLWCSEDWYELTCASSSSKKSSSGTYPKFYPHVNMQSPSHAIATIIPWLMLLHTVALQNVGRRSR